MSSEHGVHLLGFAWIRPKFCLSTVVGGRVNSYFLIEGIKRFAYGR
jgi:hypothetical protein